MYKYFKYSFYSLLVCCNLSAVSLAVEPQHLDTDTNQLIFKLLTLKAEYLGEDLHYQIEKIKPLIYATVTEDKIKQFIDWVPTLKSDEYQSLPYTIPVEIFFDNEKKIDCRDLLLGAAYYPKECISSKDVLKEWGGYLTDYVHTQLFYAYRYHYEKAYPLLQNFATSFLPSLTTKEYPFFYTKNFIDNERLITQRYTIKKVLVNTFKYIGHEKILSFESLDTAKAYFFNAAERNWLI